MNTISNASEVAQTLDYWITRDKAAGRRAETTAAIALAPPLLSLDQGCAAAAAVAPAPAITAAAPAAEAADEGVDEGYEAWKKNGRTSLKAVNIMCGIGLFIFGWLLAAAWSSAGRKGAFAIIIGLIVGLQAGAGPVVPVVYICLWAFLAVKVAGYQKRFQRETSASLQRAERQLLADPQDVAALMAKAGALKDLGQNADAAPVYRQAAEAAPANAQAHHGLGLCLFQQRNCAGALEAFTAAVACFNAPAPELVAYRGNVAAALKKLGRKAEAKAYARETKEIARALKTK